MAPSCVTVDLRASPNSNAYGFDKSWQAYTESLSESRRSALSLGDAHHCTIVARASGRGPAGAPSSGSGHVSDSQARLPRSYPSGYICFTQGASSRLFGSLGFLAYREAHDVLYSAGT